MKIGWFVVVFVVDYFSRKLKMEGIRACDWLNIYDSRERSEGADETEKEMRERERLLAALKSGLVVN